MLIERIDVKKDIRILSKESGDALLQMSLLDILSELQNEKEKGSSSEWNNPENIDSGLSGVILYMIELYRWTKEDKYKTHVDTLIEELLEYCIERPTNNFGLYTGRAGVVYVLIQRYKLDYSDTDLLKSCIQLLTDADKEYLHSNHTTNTLYNGRSGTLLVLTSLYELFQEDSIMKQIELYAKKLVEDVYESKHGLYWKRRGEFNAGPGVGLAFGTSGIGLVMSKLLELDQNINYPWISKIKNFIAAHWLEGDSGWSNNVRDIKDHHEFRQCIEAHYSNENIVVSQENNISWAYGSGGIINFLSHEGPSSSVEQAKKYINESLLSSNNQSFNLYDGICGAVSFYLNSNKVSYQNSTLDSIIDKAVSKIFTNNQSVNLSGGLFHGDLGVLYFLIKSQNKSSDEHILNPFSRGVKKFKLHVKLDSLQSRYAREAIVKKDFPRTFKYIAKQCPQILGAYMKYDKINIKMPEVVNFSMFLLRGARQHVEVSIFERLVDVFNYEKNKMNLAKRQNVSNFRSFIDRYIFQDKILVKLNDPNQDWLNLDITKADGVEILTSKWDWSFKVDFKDMTSEELKMKIIENTEVPPSNYNYIIKSISNDELLEIPLITTLRILLDCIPQCSSALGICNNIKENVKSWPVNMARQVFSVDLVNKNVEKIDDVIEELDWLFQKNIRRLIYDGVLVFKHNN